MRLRPPTSGRSITTPTPTSCPPDLLDHVDRGLRRPAGGDQIVDQQHALARRDRIGVHLDAIRAVLELVVLADGLVRELSGLAHGDEARAELHRHGAAEDEATRLDRHHLVDLLAPEGLHEALDADAQAHRVLEQGGDVAELDPRLRVIRNRADTRLDRHGTHLLALSSAGEHASEQGFELAQQLGVAGLGRRDQGVVERGVAALGTGIGRSASFGTTVATSPRACSALLVSTRMMSVTCTWSWSGCQQS